MGQAVITEKEVEYISEKLSETDITEPSIRIGTSFREKITDYLKRHSDTYFLAAECLINMMKDINRKDGKYTTTPTSPPSGWEKTGGGISKENTKPMDKETLEDIIRYQTERDKI